MQTTDARKGLHDLIDTYGIKEVLRASDSIKAKWADFPVSKIDERVPGPKLGSLDIYFVERPVVGPYTIVERKLGIIAVPLVEKNGELHVVLTEQYRGAAGKVFTELPSGGQKTFPDGTLEAVEVAAYES